jgi:hypothetical protein
MQVPETQQPIVPGPYDLVAESSPGHQEPATRFFVGSSSGVIMMVSEETAEHHHMGD